VTTIMPVRDIRKPLFALSVVLLVLAAIRIGSGEPVTNPRSATQSATQTVEFEMPSQLLGLTVNQEDISTDVSNVKTATYVGTVALFTMREGEELKASLQVAGFNDLARPDTETFRRQVIGLMGTSFPQELRVGDATVYMSPGNQQILYTWFKGRGFCVLTARRDYPFRRALLRKLLPIQIPE
jgi:hypothetical protein